tara:strand:- start:587 stop:742 length:156 start_codon:yes stop_codon:yes gene_type:complete
MTREYNWRIANWMDPEDFSVDEAVEVVADEPKEVSPFEDYKTNVIQFREVK